MNTSAPKEIEVEAVRGFLACGRTVERGQRVTLPLADALAVIDTGRGRAVSGHAQQVRAVVLVEWREGEPSGDRRRSHWSVTSAKSEAA